MRHHLQGIWHFRYFWMALVRMDLRTRYRRSVLGIGWSMLHPLMMSAVFCIVFSQIMSQQDARWLELGYSAEWRGYAAFMVAGLTVWDFIRNSTVMGCNALLHNEAYIRQCPLPYAVYPLRTVLGTAIHFVISMAVAVVLIAFLKQSSDPFLVLWAVLPVMVLLVITCWALATMAAFATVYFPDTEHLVQVGSQIMFFASPLIYTSDKLGKFEWVARINPVGTFLELIRDPLVTGKLPDPGMYAGGVAITAAAFGLACGTIAWLQKRLIFEL